MSRKQYHLGEAIKELYETTPLRPDFAQIVADQAFVSQKKQMTVWDKVVLAAFGLVISASFIYGVRLIGESSVILLLIFLTAVVVMISLSLKEHSILLKRIEN